MLGSGLGLGMNPHVRSSGGPVTTTYYTSDYSSSSTQTIPSGYYTNTEITRGESIGGEDDCLKITAQSPPFGSFQAHDAISINPDTPMADGETYDYTLKYYLDGGWEGLLTLEALVIWNSSTYSSITKDAWVTISGSFVYEANDSPATEIGLYISVASGVPNQTDDILYIKDFVVTQTV